MSSFPPLLARPGDACPANTRRAEWLWRPSGYVLEAGFRPGWMWLSDAHFPKLARFYFVKRGKDGRHGWSQVKHPALCCPYKNNPERLPGERLLDLEVAIHRDEHVKTTGGAA
jgi:hypothetical protein